MLVVLVSLFAVADDTPQAVSAAPPPPPEPPAVLATQVQALTAQAGRQADKFDAIERFLRDRQLAREGAAPKGWVQPPMSDYLAPNAPPTQIPGLVVLDTDGDAVADPDTGATAAQHPTR